MIGGRIFGRTMCGVVAAVLAAGAAQADIIDFDHSGDPVAASYTSGSFSTNSGAYKFSILSGSPAVVDLGSGLVSSATCSTAFCSDNGTQALYMFGTGGFRLESPGNIFDVTSFDAAIATYDFAYAFFNGGDNQFNTQITISGQAHTGPSPTSVTIPLLYNDPNYNFATEALSGFVGLDYVDFLYDGTNIDTTQASSGDFAVDNIAIANVRSLGTTTPPGPPTGVPEPGTLGLVGLGLMSFGWMRRKMKRNAA